MTDSTRENNESKEIQKVAKKPSNKSFIEKNSPLKILEKPSPPQPEETVTGKGLTQLEENSFKDIFLQM